MRAVILDRTAEPLVVAEVEPLPLGPQDLRIRTTASGVCHSDLTAWNGDLADSYSPPLILGHEGTGTVVETGALVEDIAVGDRVIGTFAPACLRCWQCVRGRTYLCERTGAVADAPRARYRGRDIPAMSGLGTMAEEMVVHRDSAVRIESTLADEELALIGCGVTTGVGAALWTAEVGLGSTAAVFGCGGVGMSAIQGCRIAGASRIIAVDPVASKRAQALSFGATDVVDPGESDPVAAIRELTGGRGVEYAFEAVGRVDAMRAAFDSASVGGCIVYIGALNPAIQLSLPAHAIHGQSKTIKGSRLGWARQQRDIPLLVGLAETGRLQLAEMITRRIDLTQVPDAFDELRRGEGIRSVITFPSTPGRAA